MALSNLVKKSHLNNSIFCTLANFGMFFAMESEIRVHMLQFEPKKFLLAVAGNFVV